ncbi:hypothetical protein MGYG_07904 [Nannizzia gypsea CBS 118893]|uniref:DUF3602 domain-containing protein n=1 Tax=Arthroderma gypseum (strain ATCC MYA-4604 / CBS 118893) TaxID=535722 RepID=E4V4H8_ARTGP|nr:hypothetical protein MGYG_07904 [Nannizzia gypsea CBS 118893]EFR04902.1 hypothetical protein MGYG_07904 [Nannizzia gypsea CBS 118893]
MSESQQQAAQVVSHGRGGQGNIAADSTKYVDAEIVREGVEGDQGDGAYSAGRGGVGNIGSPNVPPSRGQPHDADVIPPTAMRKASSAEYHVGRGGQGNVRSEPSEPIPEQEGHDKRSEGFVDKVKQMVFGRKE